MWNQLSGLLCGARAQVVGSSQAKCVCFNLGYLPGNNAGLVTQTDTSIAAVRAAMEVIAPGGVVSGEMLCSC